MLLSVLKWKGHVLLNNNKNGRFLSELKPAIPITKWKCNVTLSIQCKFEIKQALVQKRRRMGMKKKHG